MVGQAKAKRADPYPDKARNQNMKPRHEARLDDPVMPAAANIGR
jgi:hypothetical protein